MLKSDFMQLPASVMERLDENEMILVLGGSDSVAPNNDDGLCTGTNNGSGRCGGINNGSGKCGS